MCMNRKKQQELQNDLEFLRERFGELDGEIQLPHSLSAEMLRYKLENIDLIAEKPKRKYPVWLKPIAGVCACFVLMLGVYQVFNSQAVKSGGALEAPAPMMVSDMAAAPAAAEENEKMAAPEMAAQAPSEEDSVPMVSAGTPESKPLEWNPAAGGADEATSASSSDSAASVQPDEASEDDGLMLPKQVSGRDEDTGSKDKGTGGKKTESRNPDTAGSGRPDDMESSDAAQDDEDDGLAITKPQGAGISSAEKNDTAPKSVVTDGIEDTEVEDATEAVMEESVAEAADVADEALAVSPRVAQPRAAAFALGASDAQAKAAQDYAQVRDAVYQMSGGVQSYTDTNDTADGSAKYNPATAGAGDAQPGTGGRFSGTNTQEAGVDEGDIVKTDGEYLYSYVAKNATSKYPAIFITDADDLEVTSKIELKAGRIEEFYVTKNRLITVRSSNFTLNAKVPDDTVIESTGEDLYEEIQEQNSRKRMPNTDDPRDRRMAQAVVYDISDPEDPEQIRTFSQDGGYVSSRMVDGVLYLVSNRYVSPDFARKDTRMEELVPVVYDSVEGSARLLKPKEIAIAPDSRSASYAVVSAVNVRSGRAETKAVLGGGDGVYMSEDNLYVYYQTANSDLQSGVSSYTTTNIVKIGANGADLSLGRTGHVDGYVYGQFAFSEYKGNLRVATTADYPSGKSSNNVYVLDKNMRQVGALTGLAPGESIYSVRYMDDRAYLVTFRQVDPLFAIDLSNPEKPRLLGQLKIPGFSEYLHPVDKNTLIGIGQSADNNGQTDGLKLSMFDVSNPASPKELHVYNLGGQGSWSEALDNHRAVLFDARSNLIAFPADIRSAGTNEQTYFVFRFSKSDGFTLEKEIIHGDDERVDSFEEVQRGLYIGDTLYTFSPSYIVSYDLGTFERKDSVKLK